MSDGSFNTIMRGFVVAQLHFLQLQETRRAAPANSNRGLSETMSDQNALQKVSFEADGFDGFSDQIEGADRPEGGGVIRGTLIKFSRDSKWVTGDGEEVSADLELVAVDILRIVQRWEDQLPVETVVVEPGQPFPDVEAMNAAVPKTEWREAFGQMRGPWQSQYIVHLLNLATMDRFSYATGSIGGGIATRELADRTKWMRRLRGDGAFPVVTLATRLMHTQYGDRLRPFFEIQRWIKLDGDQALEAPAQPAIEQSKPWPTESTAKPQSVAEPTMEEILNDELPTFNKPVETKRPAAKSVEPKRTAAKKRA